MIHLKSFNESNKPEQKTIRKGVSFFDYNDMIKYLESKYNFASREFTGIPSTFNRGNHFNEWCDKHGLGKKDSKKKDRVSSQEFWKMYKAAADGENSKPPYMDFWHYLCDINEVENGSYIQIPKEVDTSDEITPQKSIEMFQSLMKMYPDDKEIRNNCEELIRREEENIKNPKVSPWANWEQKITDLIFKEFGESTKDDYLTVWVEW
jgi:hypothetical protein